MSFHLTKDPSQQSYISLSVGKNESELGFSWFFGKKGVGTLKYAKLDELVDGKMPDSAVELHAKPIPANERGQFCFHVTASALEESTEYAYQLINGETESEIMRFKTAGRGDFTFAVVGDPQLDSHREDDNVEMWAKALDVIAHDHRFAEAAFVVSTGDQIEEYNDEDDYSAFLEHEPMKTLPFATAIGNHETDSPLYHRHFNVCNFSKYARTDAGTNNHFTYNDTLFIVLNTNIYDVADHSAFIDEVLKANSEARWRIALFHNSIFTAGKHGPQENLIAFRKKLAPILSAAKIDLVLMGHDHIYCRSFVMDGTRPLTNPSLYGSPDYSSVTNAPGPVYITFNSASGSKTYDITGDYGYTVIANQEHISNVSRVTVSSSQICITTYRTHDMSVVDNFTLIKN